MSIIELSKIETKLNEIINETNLIKSFANLQRHKLYDYNKNEITADIKKILLAKYKTEILNIIETIINAETDQPILYKNKHHFGQYDLVSCFVDIKFKDIYQVFIEVHQFMGYFINLLLEDNLHFYCVVNMEKLYKIYKGRKYQDEYDAYFNNSNIKE